MKIYYWDKYYKKNLKKANPSSFAKFIFPFIKKNKTLIDIGCGNGRDSFFFSRKKINILGIEKSKIAVKKNNILKKSLKLNNIKFKKISVTEKKFYKLGKFDYIYSRFFLHAISYKTEKKFINNLFKISKNKSKIFLEFRTIKDPLIKKGKKISKYERLTDHYRRFIDLESFKKSILKLNKFLIIYVIEKKGLAKFKLDNPVVARLILRKK